MLANILIQKGLDYLVHSPGSRNAPIIIAFSQSKKVKIITAVDERSAAFYAMGLALETGKVVAIDCTSGTAALNYAPAIAEAYYQHIPLLVLTADRSAAHIDIGDGQTIRQENVFANYIKKSYSLPLIINNQEDHVHAELLINQAIDLTTEAPPGPVHINIPIDEPLYGITELETIGRVIGGHPNSSPLWNTIPKEFLEQWQMSTKIMLIAGQMKPYQHLNKLLGELTENQSVVVLTETTSNLYHSDFIDGIDNYISTIDMESAAAFTPDLLITIGGSVVSKMIKTFLRNKPQISHWHISPSGEKLDTFFCYSGTIKSTPAEFISSLINLSRERSTNYKNNWLRKKTVVTAKREIFLTGLAFSDFKVFNTILKNLPTNANLHLGNSTPVRYSQLFGNRPDLTYYCNRGVSGIDGHISTAAGVSTASSKLNVLITGDLGFLYDSNGLLLLAQCPNLKIIVINNQGGGIFRFIPGPDTIPDFDKYFEVSHQLNFKHLVKAFNLLYLNAQNEDELEGNLPKLFNSPQNAVLEVNTSAQLNAEILRSYFTGLKAD